VESPGDNDQAWLSPDGSWMLYAEWNRDTPEAPPSPSRLMRRPVAGGSSEMVLEEPAGMDWNYICPPTAGAGCVLIQFEGRDTFSIGLMLPVAKGSGLGPSKQGLARFSHSMVHAWRRSACRGTRDKLNC
jgi:hypothetical protein